MSFVFKQIAPAYKTSTPFYAHKVWNIGTVNIPDLTDNPTDGIVDSDISMSIYYGKYTQSKWLLEEDELQTTDNEYVRNIWHSTHNLYYRNFQPKPYDYYKQGHIGVETRNVSEEIQVFSIPQNIIGSGIKPGSLRIISPTHTYFDDGNGNVIGYDTSTGPSTTVYTTGSKDLYYCSFFFNEGYRYSGIRTSFPCRSHGNLGANVVWNTDSTKGIASPVYGPNYVRGDVVNVKPDNASNCPGNYFYLDFKYDLSTTGSSYVRLPHRPKLNFDTKEEFSISMWIDNTNASLGTVTLIAKNGRRKILRQSNVGKVRNGNIEYNNFVSDEVYLGAYPYTVTLNGNTISFSISDGANTNTATNTLAGGWDLVTCVKTSGSMRVYVNNTAGTAVNVTCLGSTSNDADVFMGVRGDLITGSVALTGNQPAASTGQFDGRLGPVHIFNRPLTTADIQAMVADRYNNHYGNVLYDQGQIIWANTHGSLGSADFRGVNCEFDSMQFRSTKLITTNEYICAVGPGELNMTTNPSVLISSNGYCKPNLNSEGIPYANETGECYSFVTGSDFSPYVTGIGLYNEQGDLLVVGKLATPIKKATNCDTIFIVKWDES